MLTLKMMQEIQELKKRGYSIGEVLRYYHSKNNAFPFGNATPTLRCF